MRRRGPLAGFVALGIVWGGWAALVPAIQEAVGATKGELGLALLFAGLGALPAMLLTGGLVDRRGARVLPVLLTGLAVAAVLPALAHRSPHSQPRSSPWGSRPARSTSRSTAPSPRSRRGAALA